MIDSSWRRIAGLHVCADGDIAMVWLARDGEDIIHLYDSCIFRREVLAVIAEGINARGRWIPVAWNEKDFADKLVDRGCNMITEKSLDTDAIAEVISRDVWERMRSGRFKVEKRLKDWLDEFQSFSRKDMKVPRGTHPLMAATRHAIERLDWARKQKTSRATTKNYPQISMV